MKYNFIISLILLLNNCVAQQNKSNTYQGIWIEKTMNWDTEIDYGIILNYARGKLIYLGDNNRSKFVFAMFVKEEHKDTMKIVITEGGSIYSGNWEMLDDKIIMQNKLVSDKYAFEGNKKNEQIILTDTLKIIKDIPELMYKNQISFVLYQGIIQEESKNILKLQ